MTVDQEQTFLPFRVPGWWQAWLETPQPVPAPPVAPATPAPALVWSYAEEGPPPMSEADRWSYTFGDPTVSEP